MMINDKTRTAILTGIIFVAIARATNGIIIGVAIDRLPTGLASGIDIDIAYPVGFLLCIIRKPK